MIAPETTNSRVVGNPVAVTPMIPKQQLEKFRRLYSEVFGVDLSEAEREKKASILITLFTAIYGNPLWNTNEKDHD